MPNYESMPADATRTISADGKKIMNNLRRSKKKDMAKKAMMKTFKFNTYEKKEPYEEKKFKKIEKVKLDESAAYYGKIIDDPDAPKWAKADARQQLARKKEDNIRKDVSERYGDV